MQPYPVNDPLGTESENSAQRLHSPTDRKSPLEESNYANQNPLQNHQFKSSRQMLKPVFVDDQTAAMFELMTTMSTNTEVRMEMPKRYYGPYLPWIRHSRKQRPAT